MHFGTFSFSQVIFDDIGAEMGQDALVTQKPLLKKLKYQKIPISKGHLDGEKSSKTALQTWILWTGQSLFAYPNVYLVK